MTERVRRLALIVAGAFVLRLVLLVLRGDYIVFDEGYYLLLARSLREHQSFTLNGLPHVSLSPLQPLLVALLSLPGLPDLWVSRLLGAACGALLAVPVWYLAGRVGGPRASLPAALLTVLAPALMSYLPFFPGRGWNLYFGSEPLFLLLALGSCAAAARAADEPRLGWFVLLGAAAAGAFLTRGEGVILGPLVFAVLAVQLWRGKTGAAGWRGFVVASLCAGLLALPYLLYLRGALGRWAYSGRVQAAGSAAAPAPTTRATAQRGGSVLEDFVWAGDQARFRAELYGLTPDGGRLQSQYWGVDHGAPLPADSFATPVDTPAGADTATRAAPAPRPSFASLLLRGMGVVVPWWLTVIALIGFVAHVRQARELLWLIPLAGAALIPAFAAYVEPRSLLPLVPVIAIGAALAWSAAANALALQRPAAQRLAAPALAVMAVVLVFPSLRAAAGAVGNTTPLQQLASAQRAVGSYLDGHLAPDATIMSWHPAIAVWAERDWRVMPDAPTGRLLRYAGRRANAVVFSRFHPSPLGNTPRPFTVILLDGDPGRAAFASPLSLQQVDETPLIIVGRLAPAVP